MERTQQKNLTRRYATLVMISTGEVHSIAEWAKMKNRDPETIRDMLKKGHPTDVAVGNSIHSIKNSP